MQFKWTWDISRGLLFLVLIFFLQNLSPCSYTADRKGCLAELSHRINPQLGRRSWVFKAAIPVLKSLNAAEEHGLLGEPCWICLWSFDWLAACPSCCSFFVCAVARWFIRWCAFFSPPPNNGVIFILFFRYWKYGANNVVVDFIIVDVNGNTVSLGCLC